MFEPIDDASLLANLFNKCMDAVNILRFTSYPVDFDKENIEKKGKTFYNSCLFELYLHSVIENLRSLKSISEWYIDEFEGSWKKFAATHRYEFIMEHGGDADEYDELGNIIETVSDEKLKYWSIVSEFQRGGNRNIFLNTELSDLDFFFDAINLDADKCISDLIKENPVEWICDFIYEPAKSDGKEWVSKIIFDTERDLYYYELSLLFKYAIIILSMTTAKIRSLQPDDDNFEFFKTLPGRVDFLLDLKFATDDVVDLIKAEIKEKLEKHGK